MCSSLHTNAESKGYIYGAPGFLWKCGMRLGSPNSIDGTAKLNAIPKAALGTNNTD